MSSTSKRAAAEETFLAVYEEYANGIFRFVVSKTSDREVGYDLMQETFTRAWDYYASGKEIEQWKAFLFRTAYNLIVDYYRKRRATSLDALTEDTGFVPADEMHTGARIAEGAEAARVQRAIAQLGESYSEILHLRYVEDLPVKEIASVMGLSQNVISVRIHRGIKLLRKEMGFGEDDSIERTV